MVAESEYGQRSGSTMQTGDLTSFSYFMTRSFQMSSDEMNKAGEFGRDGAKDAMNNTQGEIKGVPKGSATTKEHNPNLNPIWWAPL
jgi:hypothetical protein